PVAFLFANRFELKLGEQRDADPALAALGFADLFQADGTGQFDINRFGQQRGFARFAIQVFAEVQPQPDRLFDFKQQVNGRSRRVRGQRDRLRESVFARDGHFARWADGGHEAFWRDRLGRVENDARVGERTGDTGATGLRHDARAGGRGDGQQLRRGFGQAVKIVRQRHFVQSRRQGALLYQKFDLYIHLQAGDAVRMQNQRHDVKTILDFGVV